MKFAHLVLLTALLFLMTSCAGLSKIDTPAPQSSASETQPIARVIPDSAVIPPSESGLPQPSPIPRFDSAPSLEERLAAFSRRETEREVGLRVFPQDAVILTLRDNELTVLEPVNRMNDTAWFYTDAAAIGIRAEGYHSQVVPLVEDEITDAKIERINPVVHRIGEVPTGRQPKSVRFSPDGEYLFTIHLDDESPVSQYRTHPLKLIQHFTVPEEFARQKGFVESCILESRSELWVSQMNTDMIHIFNMVSGSYLGHVKLSGRWPKVLAASSDEKLIYVSCWISNTVSVVDTNLRQEIRSFDTGRTPRGLALSPDESSLLIALFASSAVDRVNLETGEMMAVHDSGPAKPFAMRHIVYDSRRGEYYITAMGVSRVYRLSDSGQWRGYWQVGSNPNTCDISPDGRWLAVSCRGRNNPSTGYLTKGYEFGKVFFIDLEAGQTATWIWGHDQPTGLAISPSGEYLAFTNFLSHSVELYRFASP